MFSLTTDSGAVSHFIDNQLLNRIKDNMLDYVNLDPLVTMVVAGRHLPRDLGKRTRLVLFNDQHGGIRFPAMVVPGLGR